mmetsp:Transcript_39047/g.66458  ORF Transcript_39047/g.66458 Transcript_39047/m.66458 type:complete len:285 (-) Transcript_39047:440-1294(-)
MGRVARVRAELHRGLARLRERHARGDFQLVRPGHHALHLLPPHPHSAPHLPAIRGDGANESDAAHHERNQGKIPRPGNAKPRRRKTLRGHGDEPAGRLPAPAAADPRVHRPLPLHPQPSQRQSPRGAFLFPALAGGPDFDGAVAAAARARHPVAVGGVGGLVPRRRLGAFSWVGGHACVLRVPTHHRHRAGGDHEAHDARPRRHGHRRRQRGHHEAHAGDSEVPSAHDWLFQPPGPRRAVPVLVHLQHFHNRVHLDHQSLLRRQPPRRGLGLPQGRAREVQVPT